MSDTVVTQDGINAVHFTYGSGSLFALKYFMPIYDPRIDPNIHNTPPSELDPLSTLDLAATVPVSATHGNIFGERLFNLDGNEISDTTFYLYRIDGEGSLTMNGTSGILAGISQTKPTQVNLVNGMAPSFTDSNSVQVISGSNIEGSNGTFVIADYGVVPKFNENTAGVLADRLFKVHSYAPAIGGAVSVDRGQYTAVLDATVGNFKFNKIAFYIQKVNPDFTDYLGFDPILFCITPISSVAIKTSGATDETGAYGNIGVDGMARIDHVLEIEFSTDQTLKNTSYQLVDYWTSLPTIYGQGVHHMGDVVAGSSTIPGSYDPLGHITSYDKDKTQLALAYELRKTTFFTTTSGGFLHVDTSGTNRPHLDFGENNILSGGSSTTFGKNNNVFTSASFVIGEGNESVTWESKVANEYKFHFMFGKNNVSTYNDFQYTFGYTNNVYGENTFAMGDNNRIVSDNSAIFGKDNNIADSGSGNFVVGQYNVILNSTYNDSTGNAIFGTGNVIGDGTLGVIGGFVVGFANKVTENYAVAMGVHTLVVGYGSMAIGYYSSASDATGAMATGWGNIVYGDASMAFGFRNTIYSRYGFVTGRENIVGNTGQLGSDEGEDNIVGGYKNIVEGEACFVIGIQNTVNAGSYGSLIAGNDNKQSSGLYNIMGGYSNTASDNASLIIGASNTSDIFASIIFGGHTSAIGGSYSIVGGNDLAVTDAYSSIVVVDSSTFDARYSAMFGNFNQMFADSSLVAGYDNDIFGYNNFGFGRGNQLAGQTNFAFGKDNRYYKNGQHYFNAVFGETNWIDESNTSAFNDPTHNFISGYGNAQNWGSSNATFGIYNSTSGNANMTVGYNNRNSGEGCLIGGNYSSTPGFNTASEQITKYSIAYGINCSVIKSATQAFGNNTMAYGKNSFVGGKNTNARSQASFMFGTGVNEIIENATITNIGLGSYLTIDNPEDNSNDGGVINIGSFSEAFGPYSSSLGSSLKTYGQYDINIGTSNQTGNDINSQTNYANIAIGINNIARAFNGTTAVAIGGKNTNYAAGSTALGWDNDLKGSASFSTAIGRKNIVYGNNSFAIGHDITIDESQNNTMVFNLDSTPSTSIGSTNAFVFNADATSQYAMYIRNTAFNGHGLKVEVNSRNSGNSYMGIVLQSNANIGTPKQFPFAVSTLGNIFHDGMAANGYKIATGYHGYAVNSSSYVERTRGTEIDTGIPTSTSFPTDYNVMMLQHSYYTNFNPNWSDSGSALSIFKLTTTTQDYAVETWIQSTPKFKKTDEDIESTNPITGRQANYHTFNSQLCKLINGVTGKYYPNWYIIVSNVTGHFLQVDTRYLRWSLTYQSVI